MPNNRLSDLDMLGSLSQNDMDAFQPMYGIEIGLGSDDNAQKQDSVWALPTSEQQTVAIPLPGSNMHFDAVWTRNPDGTLRFVETKVWYE
jgi:hypothetical protein